MFRPDPILPLPHIPDNSFQLVRYYGWYSNKMRGQRDKQATDEARIAAQAVEIIDVSDPKPRRIPSAQWRDLIQKVWEPDPLLCPRCQKDMRIVALIDDPFPDYDIEPVMAYANR